MKVSIVIPNFNGRNLLQKNLPKVEKAAGDTEILVVDNNSSDGSNNYIKNNFPKVKLVEEKKGQGFASSVNQGVSKASGDIIVLLNTDIIPENGFLEPLLKNFDDPKVFAVGCLDKSHEKDSIIERGRAVARFTRGMLIHSRGEVNKKNTFWVSGGSGAFRKSIWEKLKGMDDLFNPFYYEDIDLSYRAVKSGYKILFERKSIVHHYHEEGVIQTNFGVKEIEKIAFKNQFLFIWKNITDFKLLLCHIFYLPYYLLKAIFHKDRSMIIGFINALERLPIIIKKRIEVLHNYSVSDKEIFNQFSL